MTHLVHTLADHVILLPVAALMIAAGPSLLVVPVLIWLDEKKTDRAETALMLTLAGAAIGGPATAGYLVWRVLLLRWGWADQHPAWTGLLLAALLLAVVVAIGNSGARDAAAFNELALVEGEYTFTDDEIATMPEKHQAMVHTIRAMHQQDDSPA